MNAVWTIQHGDNTIADVGAIAARPSRPRFRVWRSSASSTCDATVAPVLSLTSRNAMSGSRAVDEIRRARGVDVFRRQHRRHTAVATERDHLLDQVSRLARPQRARDGTVMALVQVLQHRR